MLDSRYERGYWLSDWEFFPYNCNFFDPKWHVYVEALFWFLHYVFIFSVLEESIKVWSSCKYFLCEIRPKTDSTIEEEHHPNLKRRGAGDRRMYSVKENINNSIIMIAIQYPKNGILSVHLRILGILSRVYFPNTIPRKWNFRDFANRCFTDKRTRKKQARVTGQWRT